MANIYVGMNTVGKFDPPFTSTDIDIVKQDLLNHFMTRIGERVMMPEYGSRIWDYFMEPLDEDTKEVIYDDIQHVISQDPRVEIKNISVIEIDHALRVDLTLLFKPQDDVDQLRVDFERNSANQT